MFTLLSLTRRAIAPSRRVGPGGFHLPTIHLVLAASAFTALAFAAVPLAGATETYGCHSYEIYSGTNEQGAGVSTDDGAFALAAAGHYVVYDGPLYGGHIYSFGLGTEQNDVDGYQRYDEACEDSDGAEHPDCFLSCTF